MPTEPLIQEGKHGPELVLRGPWEERYAQYFLGGSATGLWVNYARGFVGDDVAFLERLPMLQSLLLISYTITDLSPVNHLVNLRYLGIGNRKYYGLDVKSLPHLETCGLGWQPSLTSLFECVWLKDLGLDEYKGHSIPQLANLRSLVRLVLGNSALQDISSLIELHSLYELRLQNMRKLSDLSPLLECPSIVSLSLQGSRHFTSLDSLSNLTKLRRIDFSSCGSIDSLAPLRNIQTLENVIFYDDTTIADGDLSSLDELPNLKYVAFRNRRHYNRKMDDYPHDRPSLYPG
jgi:hypothetical protein